jgi:hypothetical protein
MTSLNPRWLSIELASVDIAVSNWPTDLRKSFEASASGFHKAVSSEKEGSEQPPLAPSESEVPR